MLLSDKLKELRNQMKQPQRKNAEGFMLSESQNIEYKESWRDEYLKWICGTRGGEIHEDLRPYADEDLIFDKGCDAAVEQYSGFDGVNAAGQSLGEIVSMLEPDNVFVCGIATEFCVRNTCEDLKKAGFNVILLSDCLAYVDEAGHRKALDEMRSEGIIIRYFANV